MLPMPRNDKAQRGGWALKCAGEALEVGETSISMVIVLAEVFYPLQSFIPFRRRRLCYLLKILIANTFRLPVSL